VTADRLARLRETFEMIEGPVARLRLSLAHDEASLPSRVGPDPGEAHQQAVDAFLQRFQQATDLTLRKLLPRVLSALEASDARHPFATVLDHLDGYERIDDVSWWVELNDIRNRLTHEYAMTFDVRAAELDLAWASATRLVAEVERLRASLPSGSE
jgi:hypothetical protein